MFCYYVADIVSRESDIFSPQEVHPLDRSDVDSMIQETIASLVSAPCGVTGGTGEQSEISGPGTSTASAPARRTTVFSISGETESTDGGGRAEEESGGGEGESGDEQGGEREEDGDSPRFSSEANTEATLDVRSVLSGTRLDENERHLAEELRPGSPKAWLVDVSQGQQRVSRGVAGIAAGDEMGY